jgi:vacuolar-type H+-ATPase subunit H
MTEERTLLQQIREKELLLNIKIEDARRDAEDLILSARKEATEMIANSEHVEETTAKKYYEIEMEEIKKEITQLRSDSDRQAISVRENGERGLPLAIDKIIKSVLME